MKRVDRDHTFSIHPDFNHGILGKHGKKSACRVAAQGEGGKAVSCLVFEEVEYRPPRAGELPQAALAGAMLVGGSSPLTHPGMLGTAESSLAWLSEHQMHK